MYYMYQDGFFSDFIEEVLAAWSKITPDEPDMSDDPDKRQTAPHQEEAPIVNNGRTNNLDIFWANPRLRERWEDIVREDKKITEEGFLLDIFLSSGVDPDANPRNWKQNIFNWMYAGEKDQQPSNMITSQGKGLWVDFLSALERQLNYFSGVCYIENEYRRLDVTPNDPFQVFFDNYKRMMNSLNQNLVVPFYIRSVDDIAAMMAIYLGGGCKLRKEIKDKMQQAIEKPTEKERGDGTNVQTLRLEDIFVQCLNQSLSSVGEGETRQEAVVQSLVNFAQKNRRHLTIMKHEAVFQSVWKKTQSDCVEFIKTKGWPGNDFTTGRFSEYAKENLERIFVVRGEQIGSLLSPSFVASVNNIKNDENRELFVRLYLLRMHLIVHEFARGNRRESYRSVMRRINASLNDSGFSELSVGRDNVVVAGCEFDWVVNQCMRNLFG